LQQFKVIQGLRSWCQWKAYKGRKLLILPTPLLFDAPARGDPFRIL